jgi:exopolysaccharide production protein ExoQ
VRHRLVGDSYWHDRAVRAERAAVTVADRTTLALFAGASGVTAAAIVVFEPSAIVTVAALPAVLTFALLAWGVLRGSRTAILLLVFIAVFLLDAVFRVREYQDKDVDFQVVLKLGVWAMITLVALFHIRSWFPIVVKPTNIPLIMFLTWLFVTATVSPSPAYSAVAAFSILTYVLFSAYLFSTFDEVEIFAAIAVALIVFCIVSIIVYFAVPTFGHYVYWLNGERYVSPRLAGIAGSANNAGRIAAFALVITGLYAREFYHLSRMFVPTAAIVGLITLVMTNSRTSIMMVAAILFVVYFVTWHRLYIAVLMLSVGLVALAIVLPAGDQVLMLLSRGGSMDEVTSMTGRTEIWYAVAKLAEAKPLMGYGYGSSVFVLPQHEREIGFLTSHAHNLALQLFLTTGWVGVVLFALSTFAVALRAVSTGNRTVFALLSFVLLNGITESSGFTTLANICSLAFAIAATLPPAERIDEVHPSYQRGFS